MSHDYPIEILMIDDDDGNYISLKNYAASLRVILKYSSNLEDGISALKSNKKIMAIILDGKGFINSNQIKGSERENFVHEAMSRIAVFEQANNIYYPKCVYTAWYEKLIDSLEGRIEVFDKNLTSVDEAERSRMFKYLRGLVHKMDAYQLREKYSLYFEIVASKFDVISDERFFQVVEKMDKGNPVKSDFNNIRDVLESILIYINKNFPKLLPENLFHNNGRPNLEFCIRFLAGERIDKDKSEIYTKTDPRAPQHVNSLFRLLKEGASVMSHNYTHRWTQNMYKSLVFGLFEILIWIEELDK